MRHRFIGRLTVLVALAVVAAALAVASAGPVAAQAGGYRDVPDDAYYAASVSALAALGVFDDTECAGGFCPNDPIDRKTMAVWIVRMLDGEDPLPITESRFDDVEGTSFYAPFIERMYHLSVTSGCGDGREFCPDLSVSRAQMAVFLSRGYQLPDGPDPGFGDVAPGAWYAADVARLVRSGITSGCRDGTVFCPGQPTTRGQMAVFLHRAESRNRWMRAQGVTEDGFYVEFRATVNLTELRWRPQGLALVVRCTDAVDKSGAIVPELDVFAFGYGKRTWFFGDYGLIEYYFGDEGQVRLIYADPSEDNNALTVHDDEEERFLDAMDEDTGGELFLSLSDERHDGSFVERLTGRLSVIGYRQYVKPLVEACD